MKKSEEDLLLKFMGTTISKVNTCLANIYAIETVLIEKGITSKNEMLSRIIDAKKLPQTKLGRSVLSEMIQDTDHKPNWEDLIDISKSNELLAQSEKNKKNI